MTETAAQLLTKVLSLGGKDRASIAGAMIESLHGEPEPGVEGAWAVEIERRVKELDAGKITSIPWSEVK